MIIDGKLIENETCKRCRFRHPPSWTCEQAREVAAKARAEREAGYAEAEAAPSRTTVGELADLLVELSKVQNAVDQVSKDLNVRLYPPQPVRRFALEAQLSSLIELRAKLRARII